MDDDWNDPPGLYDDDEDDDKKAKRPRLPVEAWGDTEIADGQDGEDVLKRMARSHAELAVQTLAEVATNGDKDVARVAASKELLARGFGMPTRRTEQKVDVKIQDQRAAHFEALKQLAAQNPVLDIQDAEFEEIPNGRRLSKENDDAD